MLNVSCPKCHEVLASIGGMKNGMWYFQCQGNGHGYFTVPTKRVLIVIQSHLPKRRTFRERVYRKRIRRPP